MSLQAKYPKIFEEIHPLKNSNIDIKSLTADSNVRLWFQCYKSSDHEWQTNLKYRIQGYGCPFCSARKLRSAQSDFDELLIDESKYHEFKASLRTPYPDLSAEEIQAKGAKKSISKELEHAVLKTIASFLNTNNGTLVIGVHEKDNNKNIIGIKREGFKSNDEYQRHIIQLANNKFGKDIVSNYMEVDIITIDDADLCVIKIKKLDAKQIAYLDEELFVRTGPRVDKLSVQEAVNFVQNKS